MLLAVCETFEKKLLNFLQAVETDLPLLRA